MSQYVCFGSLYFPLYSGDNLSPIVGVKLQFLHICYRDNPACVLGCRRTHLAMQAREKMAGRRQVVFEASPRIPGERLEDWVFNCDLLEGSLRYRSTMLLAPQVCDASKQFPQMLSNPSAEIFMFS